MEDLKKSVLIKGDNIIGFTGRGVLPITQEEFNALPPEKQLNGSYYITDGTDEIVISDNEVSENQLWSSQKISNELSSLDEKFGIKQVFYASAIYYPSVFWVLSDATTGVFWFKHTLSSSVGIQSVEGYADLTHNVVRLINESDISVNVETDEISGKKGVKFIASWGDNATTSCKIIEARPVTAIPTQIVPR